MKKMILFVLAGVVLLMTNDAYCSYREADRQHKRLAATNGTLMVWQIRTLVKILAFKTGAACPGLDEMDKRPNCHGSCSYSDSWELSIPKNGRGGSHGSSCADDGEPLEYIVGDFQSQLENFVRFSTVPGVFEPCISLSWQQKQKDAERTVYLLKISYEDKVLQSEEAEPPVESDSFFKIESSSHVLTPAVSNPEGEDREPGNGKQMAF